MGVFPPQDGVIGSLHAAEALNLLAEIGTPSAVRLLMFDGLRLQWSAIRVPRQADCPVCGAA
jgi:molybdopterin/thiamine biosynthesis adenylyltransferase